MLKEKGKLFSCWSTLNTYLLFQKVYNISFFCFLFLVIFSFLIQMNKERVIGNYEDTNYHLGHHNLKSCPFI